MESGCAGSADGRKRLPSWPLLRTNSPGWGPLGGANVQEAPWAAALLRLGYQSLDYLYFLVQCLAGAELYSLTQDGDGGDAATSTAPFGRGGSRVQVVDGTWRRSAGLPAAFVTLGRGDTDGNSAGRRPCMSF